VIILVQEQKQDIGLVENGNMIKLTDILNEIVKDGVITCDKCGWHWDISDGYDGGETNPYLCHKCGNDNTPIKEDLRKWFGKGGGWKTCK